MTASHRECLLREGIPSSSRGQTRCAIPSCMSTADDIRAIANQFSAYAGLFNLVVGAVGNLLLIVIFTHLRVFRHNQCSVYLIVESCSNLCFVLVRYTYRIPTLTFASDPVDSSPIWCKCRTAITQACGLASLLTITCMALDQYLATHYQYHFRQLSTLRLAYRLTICSGCFAVMHSILFVMFYDARPPLGCAAYEPAAKKYFSFFYYPILNGALPLLITVSFSLLAYRSVRRIVRRQMPIVRRRLDRQLTAMVLARVVCLVILGAPYLCNILYQLNINADESNAWVLAIALLVSRVVAFLLGANFSITFYVFLATNARFRRQVEQFLVKQISRLSGSCSCTANTSLSRGNRIAPAPKTTLETFSAVQSV